MPQKNEKHLFIMININYFLFVTDSIEHENSFNAVLRIHLILMRIRILDHFSKKWIRIQVIDKKKFILVQISFHT